MWVKTGSELWEIMHMLTSNKISCNRKCSISLAKYAEPFFDVEHIYVIEANSLFLPSHSKCFSEDEFSFQEIYDEVIETIVNRCEDFNIPSPNLVEKDDKGYFLQWDDTFHRCKLKNGVLFKDVCVEYLLSGGLLFARLPMQCCYMKNLTIILSVK